MPHGVRILLLTGAATCCLTMGAVRADILISAGGGGSGENVLFSDHTVDHVVYGEINGSGESVKFESTQWIFAPSSGQARIAATTDQVFGSLTAVLDICFELDEVGMSIQQAIFNPAIVGQVGGASTLKVTAFGSKSVSQTFELSVGENFITVQATDADYITKICLEVEQGDEGFTDLRQVRITPMTTPTAVPEPSSAILAVLGAGLVAFAAQRKIKLLRARSV